MNSELIAQFSALQNYFKDQKDIGRTIAYGKAIAALKTINTKIVSINQLKNISGIGPKVIEKVKEYLETGEIKAAETAKKELKKEKKLSQEQQSLLGLETVWGVGSVKAKSLYKQGIHNIEDLKKKSYLLTDQQKIGLKYRDDLLKKIPRDIITSVYVIMKIYIEKKFGKKFNMEIAGSYRREVKESGDIDCLVTSETFTLHDLVSLLKEKNIVTDVLSMRKEKFMGIAHCPSSDFHFRLDIEFVPKESWGSALLYFTGSKGFNVYMRDKAKKKGLLLNEHGIYDVRTGNKIINYPTEEDIFRIVGINFVEPSRR